MELNRGGRAQGCFSQLWLCVARRSLLAGAGYSATPENTAGSRELLAVSTSTSTKDRLCHMAFLFFLFFLPVCSYREEMCSRASNLTSDLKRNFLAE